MVMSTTTAGALITPAATQIKGGTQMPEDKVKIKITGATAINGKRIKKGSTVTVSRKDAMTLFHCNKAVPAGGNAATPSSPEQLANITLLTKAAETAEEEAAAAILASDNAKKAYVAAEGEPDQPELKKAASTAKGAATKATKAAKEARQDAIAAVKMAEGKSK